MTRCMFRCEANEPLSPGNPAHKLVLRAHYDEHGAVPEALRFAKYTPSGCLEMIVDNPPAVEQFTVGEYYFIDVYHVGEVQS